MRKLLSTTGLILAIVLFAVVNLFVGTAVRAARVDLTENGLFTLSDGTKKILSRLGQKIRLRYYFSKDLVSSNPEIAHLADYAKRVQELLEEYVVHGNGKLTMEVIDPAAFSKEEDDAVAFGLSNPAANAAGDRLFFGLVATNSVDDERTIAFFDQRREEFLEYDVSEMISDLAAVEKPVVGVISSLPVNGRFISPNQPPEPAWYAIEQLQRGFETRELPIASTTEIPEDVKILVLIHPKNVSQDLYYAIDQVVMKGGKVIAFVDPFCHFDQEVPPGGNPMMAQKDSNLQPLFDAWGVELAERKLAGDREAALPIAPQGEPVPMIVLMGLKDDAFSKTDVVTGNLKLVQTFTAGILRPKSDATTKFEPLLQTGEQSQEVDAMSVQFGLDPKSLLSGFVPSGERLVIAARVSGPAKSAFPDGKPAAAETESEADAADEVLDPTKPEETADETAAAEGESGEESVEPAGAAHVAETEAIQVILVADADMLQDSLWVQKTPFFDTYMIAKHADNGDILMNAVENLSGDSDLISLRSRGRSLRPFDKKEEIAREADARYRSIEEGLVASLRDTEQQLSQLQMEKSEAEQLILTEEQEAAIAKFEEERQRIRGELRDVRHDLRKDIDALGSWLKFVNIGLIPLVITAAGLAWLGSQNWRRKTA